MTKIVAIHQPNFFPWLGYFDKIVNSDTFIILDDVQFPKTNGNWSNRVKLFISGEGRWVTAPIKRNYQGTLTINEMNFDDSLPWRKKFLKTLETNYRKADYYNENVAFINSLINNSMSNIAEYNTANILAIVNYLGIQTTKIKRASEFNVNSVATQRLIDLVKACDAQIYLCGGGASGYQDDSLYEMNEITLKYQNYEHPIYEQKNNGEFIKGLSIIDALMNMGKDEVQSMLINNVRNIEE